MNPPSPVEVVRRGIKQPCRDGCPCSDSVEYREAITALDTLVQRLAEVEGERDRLKDLAHRWNVSASRAGIAGSEYIDDPEFVFKRVEQGRELERKFRDTLRTQRDEAVKVLRAARAIYADVLRDSRWGRDSGFIASVREADEEVRTFLSTQGKSLEGEN